MPTTWLSPVSQIGSNCLTYGCSSGQQCSVCLATYDGDTTHVGNATSSWRYSTCNPSSLPGSATAVSACQEYAYCREARNAATSYVQIYIGASWSGSIAVVGTGYGGYNTPHDPSRLTVANMNSDPLGCNLYCDYFDCKCSYVGRYVTYTEGGPWFQILSAWLGPALFGAQLTIKDIIGAARSAAYPPPGKNPIYYFDWEIKEMWKSYKDHEYKAPKYFEFLRSLHA